LDRPPDRSVCHQFELQTGDICLRWSFTRPWWSFFPLNWDKRSPLKGRRSGFAHDNSRRSGNQDCLGQAGAKRMVYPDPVFQWIRNGSYIQQFFKQSLWYGIAPW
jgi:hypothetical protein